MRREHLKDLDIFSLNYFSGRGENWEGALLGGDKPRKSNLCILNQDSLIINICHFSILKCSHGNLA